MTVKKEDPDELTLEQIKRAPTWVKAAVGMRVQPPRALSWSNCCETDVMCLIRGHVR